MKGERQEADGRAGARNVRAIPQSPDDGENEKGSEENDAGHAELGPHFEVGVVGVLYHVGAGKHVALILAPERAKAAPDEGMLPYDF